MNLDSLPCGFSKCSSVHCTLSPNPILGLETESLSHTRFCRQQTQWVVEAGDHQSRASFRVDVEQSLIHLVIDDDRLAQKITTGIGRLKPSVFLRFSSLLYAEHVRHHRDTSGHIAIIAVPAAFRNVSACKIHIRLFGWPAAKGSSSCTATVVLVPA